MITRKLILFTAASLDGFLAATQHNLDWLFDVPGDGDNGISKFLDTVDTVIMGRKHTTGLLYPL